MENNTMRALLFVFTCICTELHLYAYIESVLLMHIIVIT